MKTVTVALPENGYDILIGGGALKELGGLIKPYAKGRVAVVTDENVWGQYREAFTASLHRAGIEARPVVLPPGERMKSMEGLSLLYGAFAEMKFRRDGLVIAFGGGVVGDLCGFAAATYMRGVPYIQVPTTLLAQVDSSVGGKTAVNLAQGKNLAGAFYQPKRVVIDPLTLRTLPEREYCCGMAEVIKYAAILDSRLWETLKNVPLADLTDVIEICCRLKADIVTRDERDRGERMLLNFGHTFGHALEAKYSYERYNHGEAVAVGMGLAAAMGEAMGLTETGTAKELRRMLLRHGLDTALPCPPEELPAFVEADKKGEVGGVRMVFLKLIGKSVIQSVGFEVLAGILGKAAAKWTTAE